MSTLQFEGVDYLDGTASDPNLLGLMQGSPASSDKIVRFRGRPVSSVFLVTAGHWSHMRELVPDGQRLARRGSLPGPGCAHPAADESNDRRSGHRRSHRPEMRWVVSLSDTYTDGIAVLHRGRLVYERYLGALRPQLPHACFSITKFVRRDAGSHLGP